MQNNKQDQNKIEKPTIEGTALPVYYRQLFRQSIPAL